MIPDFDRSVFINCPFDDDFAPLLKAIAFAVIALGFQPRLATERSDSGERRLDKIRELIESSRWSIHDLSRCKARRKGEMFRLNMPFELGIDFGCRHYAGGPHDQKRFLILEEERFRIQAALSDISGCDIESHGGDALRAMGCVRHWLHQTTGCAAPPPSVLQGQYLAFQGWALEEMIAAGGSEADFRERPTFEILNAMRDWDAAGRPLV